MNIYLVRHAEKDASSKTSVKEHYHRKLTDLGFKQAQMLANQLENYSVNKIYSSDMQRAVQTANSVANNLGIKNITENKDLREADPCIIPNHPDRESIKIKCWADWDYKPENGESYNEGKERFSKYFWKNIVGENNEQDNILVVSHGRIIRLFLSDFLKGGKETTKERYNHVAITHLIVDKNKSNLVINTYNDNSYLPEGLRI